MKPESGNRCILPISGSVFAMSVLFANLATNKSMYMRKTLFHISVCLALAGCTTPHEEQLEIYSDAVEAFYDTESMSNAIGNLLVAEMSATRVYVLLPESEKNEFVNRLESDEAIAVGNMRDSLIRITEKAFLSDISHFIEKRTMLYNEAVECYGDARSAEELHAIEEFVSSFSAMAYSEGERACDPPAEVREKYKESQENAARAYSDAERRFSLQE